MTNYVGVDVSQKTTTLCIVDGEGHRRWRGECVTSPEQIMQAVLQHAGADARIGIETGPMTPWLVHGLRSQGLEVICLDARHARAALRMQLNKTDRNDAEGLAQIMRTAAARFLRQPSRPSAPRPVAKSGRAAGTGVAVVAAVNSMFAESKDVPRI